MMNKIKIYGKEYPARVTMGAMRRYKRETGQDVSLMGNDIDLLVTFMYCCIVSACNADDVPFDMDMDKFADGLGMDDLNGFAESISPARSDSKKKKGKAPEVPST
jgi:hypothetical protein|nr:MAG TPA: tail assembly chaperone protein [Caudoviricetes sp.]